MNSYFFIHFLLSNIIISLSIVLILVLRHLSGSRISKRISYCLWFPVLGLFFMPFFPIGFFFGKLNFRNISASLVSKLSDTFSSTQANLISDSVSGTASASSINNITDDLTVSVFRLNPELSGIFTILWLSGALFVLIFYFHSTLRLRTLKSSSLPLQNSQIARLYTQCRQELHIRKEIPIYSTAFLNSPVTTGILKPAIYLPIHLISDCDLKNMRFMLLHELQHYRYKDCFINMLLNLVSVLYWCNPLVWLIIREIRADREIACDSSVLDLINEQDYFNYGSSLIGLAERCSLSHASCTTGMGGSSAQIKRRITSIVSHRPSTRKNYFAGIFILLLVICFSLFAAPYLMVYASISSVYEFHEKYVSLDDNSSVNSCFDGYRGSFVLYDTAADQWSIYEPENAMCRYSPDSTYKIYSALIGLETGAISNDSSEQTWDGTAYSFEQWNKNQDLNSAMANSVNWYFQSLDARSGKSTMQDYFDLLDYGNRNLSAPLDSYWLESTLKISPVEQVLLLKNLDNNSFDFDPENIQSVKDSLLLSMDSDKSLYGKTGTGRINGCDVNGWFVGFLETYDTTCYFAVNIQAEKNATGVCASTIALNILSQLGY